MRKVTANGPNQNARTETIQEDPKWEAGQSIEKKKWEEK